jgi:hypothetical protein
MAADEENEEESRSNDSDEDSDEVESSEESRSIDQTQSKQSAPKSSPSAKSSKGGRDPEDSTSESSESREFLTMLGDSGLSEVVFANLSRAARLGSGLDEEVSETSDFALKTMEKLAFHYKQFSTGVDDVLFDQAYLESRKKGKKDKQQPQLAEMSNRNQRRGGFVLQGDIRDGHNAKNKSMMQKLLALQSANSDGDDTPRERLAFRSGADDLEPAQDPKPAYEVHIKKTGRAYVHQNDRWRKPSHVII